MPTRTEIVISFGEILECLPPGKSYRRKRYNSFDANIGNEENLDPCSISEPCDNMKPDSKKVHNSRRRISEDTDDEISFRDIAVNGHDSDDVKGKNKRKSNTEKFLEDNANYFQLEVLNSKTRSHKTNDGDIDSEDDESKEGFHTSFLDFLKAKGVSKESGRSRHKSAETDNSRVRRDNGRSRSRSSFKRYGRSRSSGRSLNGRERSLSRSRSRKKSITDADGSEVFISESDSECSVRLPRLDLVKSRVRSASPSGCSDTSTKSYSRNTRSKSTARDGSPAGSDVDSSSKVRNKRSKSRGRPGRPPKSSVRESTPVELNRPRRRSRKDASPVASDAESSASTTSKSFRNKEDSEDDDEKESPSKRRGRRSELDKLLEAVDTSFHFETAAAEKKRLSDSGLGPLEIDCSDTGSETSCKVASKRKMTPVEKSPGRKRFRGSNNLLKTASPGSAIKSEAEDDDNEDNDFDEDCIWDGWDKLNEDIDNITEDPVEINKMHFSFETVPMKESWFMTYERQDRGDELVYYPSSTSHSFPLPYQMPYSAFLLNKPLKKDPDASNEQSKASSPVRNMPESSRKGDKRKISDCESTDSSEDPRRGRAGRPSKLDKIRAQQQHLFESNYRVSPRCHASTKSLGIGSQPDIDDLEEAYLFQDERDMGLSALASLPAYLAARDDNSNDSFSSSSAGAGAGGRAAVRPESQSEVAALARSLDTLLQDPGELGQPPPGAQQPAKVPPTRSRVSSEQLLSPKKVKKKKKVSVDGPGPEPGLDQLVADNVDPVLLDCLEDELPTVPGPLLEPVLANPLDLLETFSDCKSMSVCNSRWLKPNNRESLGSAKKELKNKKVMDPFKPKRIIIYKDDLPGFEALPDEEEEKMPVSKRGKSKVDKQGSPDKKKKEKVPSKRKNDPPASTSPLKIIHSTLNNDQSEDDVESVESFSSTSSTSKKRRKTNKTGFPTPKKKKKLVLKDDSPKEKAKKGVESKKDKSPEKTDSKVAKKSPKKEGPKKQKKMDEFVVKKGSKSSPVASASKRSVALKAKNYSEIESDTESLLDVSLMVPVRLKTSSVQKIVKKR